MTGDLDGHDLALPPDGRPVFVNTLFSGLATVDENHSFVLLWRPRFVTLGGASDVADGRREQARCAVMAIDLRSGDTPRWLRFQGAVQERCDVTVIPGVWRPAAIGFMGEDIKRFMSFDA